ncbi:MAG: diguanylate cyclase [Alphaproteobacteria bacterium]|nr:diguanylate cyclase [Alphaproteobacteria bacterium]
MKLQLASDTEPEPARQPDPLVVSLLQENERLQTELNEQRRNVELFRSVFDCLPDGLAIADQNRTIQISNPGLSELFGYSKEELVGAQTALLYESKEEFEIQGRARFNLTAEEQLAPYQVKYRKKDGGVFSGETIGTPLRNSGGRVIGYLGAIRDVTEREQVHRKTAANESLLNLIAHSLPELVNYVSADHTLRFVNSTAEKWYDRKREDLIGTRFEDVLGPTASQIVLPCINKALTGQKVKKRAEIKYPDGVTRAVEISYVPDMDEMGAIRGFVALVVDVSNQRKIERELIASETRLTDAVSAIPDGFAYFDHEDALQLFNEQYRAIYPKSAHLIVQGTTFDELIRDGVERGQYQEAIGNEEAWIKHRIEAHRNPGDPLEQRLDDRRWLRIEERKTRDGGTVGIRVDITDAKRREHELERLSVTDALTGLSNRRSFLDRIAQEHERVGRYGGVMSVLLIDVDHFKRINDTYGHVTGDVVLKELAGVLADELRDPDVVCRYGGEEFAAFLPETSMGGAFSTAERVREAVHSRQFCAGNPKIQVSVSIGVTQSDQRDKRYENALVRADRALYQAKEAGRNQVIVAPPEAGE